MFRACIIDYTLPPHMSKGRMRILARAEYRKSQGQIQGEDLIPNLFHDSTRDAEAEAYSGKGSSR
jgi:hypothetical protein